MRIWPSKRRWKHIGIAAVLLISIALIANGFMAWLIESRWRSRIAAVRAAGEPASIVELAPKAIPDDRNAAALLAKLAPRLDEFSKDSYQFFDKDPLGVDYDKRIDRGKPATAAQIDALRKMLDRYPDLDTGLAAVAACDQYASVADYSVDYRAFTDQIMFKQMGRVREAARFLKWRMYVLIAEGQQEKAIERGIDILKLARHYDHEPAVINMLVTVAIRGIATEPLYDALAAGAVSPKLHQTLDQELALHEDPQRLVRTMKSERAFAIDSSESQWQSAEMPRWLFQITGWSMKRFYVGAIDGLGSEIDKLAKENSAGSKIVGRRMAPKPGENGILNDLMLPALQAAYDADARCIAQLRALRIFNAMRHFAEKNGREITELDELGLPKKMTIDPFDGKPLKLKKTDKGWMVYTVMLNGVDDGGDFMEMKDFGVAPPRLRLTSKPETASEEQNGATK